MHRPCLGRSKLAFTVLVLLFLLGGDIAMPALMLREGHRTRRADRDIIESMESQWHTAIMSGDSTMLEKLLSDDFMGISSNGTVTDKQGYIQGITARKRTFSRLDISETKIRMAPNSAIVTSKAFVDGHFDGTPIHGVFRYTRVYSRKTTGTWKVVNFEATRVSANGTDAPDLRSGVPIGH